MLLALNKIKELEAYFQIEKEAQHIRDFRVMLQLNMRIEVHLLLNSSDDLARYSEMFKEQNDSIRLREIIYEEGETYDWLFPVDMKLRENVGPRRRLSNLIDLQDIDLGINCPIATFYSYKGGMGRSTTLAAFASYLAIHHGKKVVIVDCDFEAPGFTNYFDLDLNADNEKNLVENNESQKSGIVEYLLDSQFAKLAKTPLDIRKDYAYEVAQPYVEKGSIFIIPAGNLSSQSVNGNGKTHRDHYLESLARIDITSVNEVVAQFKDFISEVYTQLELNEESVILFDSRTGFNDVFSILASISNIIVGFFGINKQTKTGLFQFLDTFGNIENKSIFLANSLVYSPAEERVFNSIIKTYFDDNAERFEDLGSGLPKFASKTFSIEYNQTLRYIGVEKIEDDYKQDVNGSSINTAFIKIINEKRVFNDLFDAIISHIQFLVSEKKKDDEIELLEETPIEKKITSPLSILLPSNKVEIILATVEKNDDFFEARKRFIETIFSDEHFPKNYADDKIPDVAEFFFRDCMKGFFNRDAFLVVGYKGTGKTLIYQSLKNSEIIVRLCQREGKESKDYIFIDILPINTSPNFFVATEEFAPREFGAENMNVFYKNFWLTYIWSRLYSSHEIKTQFPNLSTSMPLFEVSKLSGFANWFRSVAFDSQVQGKILADIKALDDALKGTKKRLIITFDQLDFAVKPEAWSMGISPLINFWRSNPFNRIMPKIFLRADLFENLSGITNSKNLQSHTIDLAWKKEEIFEYFFKYIFRCNKDEFYKLIFIENKFSKTTKFKLAEIDKELDADNQIMSEINSNHLRFLAENFFGKYADKYQSDKYQSDRFGESYDWFFINLQDAKKAISIRPFLSLMKKASDKALSEIGIQRQFDRTVISAWYYADNEVRASAASEYFSELAVDAENDILRPFRDFMQTEAPDRLRVYEYSREKLDELLTLFKKHPSYINDTKIQEKDVPSIKRLLIRNGILEETFHTNRNYTRYVIPYLYRNFFKVGRPD